MFRCENCGSGYSVRAASSWESCPRCLARDKTSVPLTFELGWRSSEPAKKKIQRMPLKGERAETATPSDATPSNDLSDQAATP